MSILSMLVKIKLIKCHSSDDEISIDSDSDSGADEEGFLTELDHYLMSGRVKDVKDPLQWWFDNRGSYPRLSRMARDFLTIPGEFFSFL